MGYREGGWGWVVVLAAVTCRMIVYGNLKALGVLIITIVSDLDSEMWLIGWTSTMYIAVQHLFAPISSAVAGLVGRRPVIITGGVVTCIGFVLVSRATTLPQFVVCVVIAGMGSCAFALAPNAVVATYFNEGYAIPAALLQLGGSLGVTVYGPMTQLLLDTYGWRGAVLLIAGISSFVTVCGMVSRDAGKQPQQYQEILTEDRGNSSENVKKSCRPVKGISLCKKFVSALDLSIFCDVRFLLVSLTKFTRAFCFAAATVYMVSNGQVLGLSAGQASLLPVAWGAGNTVAKIAASAVMYKRLLWCRLVMTAGVVAASLGYASEAVLSSFWTQMSATALIGLGDGLLTLGTLVHSRYLLPDDKLLGVYSWQALICGIADISGGFLSGWFYEMSGSFATTYLVFCGVQLSALVFLFLDCVYVRKRKTQPT